MHEVHILCLSEGVYGSSQNQSLIEGTHSVQIWDILRNTSLLTFFTPDKTKITKWYEMRWMSNRMEWSWLIVLIKVEQLFLSTCVVKSNRKLHGWMRWRWVDTKWRWDTINDNTEPKFRDSNPHLWCTDIFKLWFHHSMAINAASYKHSLTYLILWTALLGRRILKKCWDNLIESFLAWLFVRGHTWIWNNQLILWGQLFWILSKIYPSGHQIHRSTRSII
jgi:hypothetical protein